MLKFYKDILKNSSVCNINNWDFIGSTIVITKIPVLAGRGGEGFAAREKHNICEMQQKAISDRFRNDIAFYI